MFHVIHRVTQLQRAMKVIPKYLIKERENKLFDEVEILKSLDHPNIVNVYEIFMDDDNYYVIMEYLSGGDLF